MGITRKDEAHVYLNADQVVEFDVKKVIPQNTELGENEMTVPDILSDCRPDLEALLSNGEVWRLDISLRHSDYHSSNLFNSHVYGDGSVSLQPFRDYLDQRTVLHLFVIADNLRSSLDVIQQAMQDDRKNDPYDSWYPAHRRRHFIQLGDYPTPEDRPVVLYSTRKSFHSWSDYITVYGFGAIYEQERHDSSVRTLEDKVHQLRTVTIPGAGSRRYFGFLSAQDADNNDHELYPGDKLQIVFDYDLDDLNPSLDWGATVMDPLPMTPTGSITIMLTRRWDGESQSWQRLEPELDPIDVHTVPDILNASNAIAASEARSVKIKILDSDLPFRRSISALRAMTDESNPNKTLLLCNGTSSLDFVDLYEGIDGLEGYEQTFSFNQEQTQAYKKLRRLPGGICLVHGPPGTGKSRWGLSVLEPLICHRLTHRDEKKQVMILGPSNAVADHLAQTMNSLLQDRYPGHHLIVTRCHAISTEEDLITHRAGQARPRGPNDRPPVLDPDADIDGTLDDMVTASIISRAHTKQTVTPSGTSDRRLKLVQLSLAYRMLQLSGIVEEPFSDRDSYRQFVSQFRSYERGDEFSQEDMSEFRQNLKALRDNTLALSDAIVCTAFTASATCMRENVHPIAILVDEAARLTEPELWPVLGGWYAPKALILVGDHYQLRPLVFSKATDNPFAGSLRMAFFTRLQLSGFNSTMFLEQRRMVKGICDLVSEVFYNNQLRTATHLDGNVLNLRSTLRAYAGRVDNFNKAQPVLFVDNPDCVDSKDSRGRSVVNELNSLVTYALLNSLIVDQRISPNHITILTPYRGQRHLYISFLGTCQQFRDVKIETIDSFQGCESGVIILDLTAEKNLAFVSEPNRLCVALSRARAGLFIVGPWKKYLQYKPRGPRDKRNHGAFEKFLKFLVRTRARATQPGSFTPLKAAGREQLALTPVGHSLSTVEDPGQAEQNSANDNMSEVNQPGNWGNTEWGAGTESGVWASATDHADAQGVHNEPNDQETASGSSGPIPSTDTPNLESMEVPASSNSDTIHIPPNDSNPIGNSNNNNPTSNVNTIPGLTAYELDQVTQFVRQILAERTGNAVTFSEDNPNIEPSSPVSQAGTLVVSTTTVDTEDGASTIVDSEAQQPGDLTTTESQPHEASFGSHDVNTGTTWDQEPEDPTASQPSEYAQAW